MTLLALREHVKSVLTDAGITAVEYVSEHVVPPIVVVVPGSPYLNTGEDVPFGQYNVNLNLLLLAAQGTNQAAAAELDNMIEQVLDALDDWDVTEVLQPGQVAANGSSFLGTIITIENTTKIGGQ